MIQLEDPRISNTLRTGWPDGREPTAPICPICGGECSEIYHDRWHNLLGCDLCVLPCDAWEEPECFPDRDDE